MKTPGLPVTLELDGERVIVIGAVHGEEARRKLELLADAGAIVEEHQTLDAMAILALGGARLAILVERDVELAASVHEAAQARGVLCWCADDPAHSDFTMPAIARLGAARIAVSTAGSSPTLSSRLRQLFEAALGERFSRFVDELGRRRDQLKSNDPGAVAARMSQLLDGFDLRVDVRYPDWFKD